MTNRHEKSIRAKLSETENFLFVLPHLFFFTAVFLVPIVYGVCVGFTNWNFVSAPKFVGIANYKALLFGGGVFAHDFYNGLKNTLLYVLFCLPFLMILPLFIANFLCKISKGSRIYQAAFYLPSLLSVTTVVLMFRFFFDRELGIVNILFHLDTNWRASQPFTWIALVILSLWNGIGGNMIIMMAGISDIPKSYYEAATLNGANSCQCFFLITLPMIRFQLCYCLIMTMISCFNVYCQPLLFSGGAPHDSTRVMIMYITSYAFGSGSSIAGMASAMSVLLGLVIFAFSLVQYKLLNREDTV